MKERDIASASTFFKPRPDTSPTNETEALSYNEVSVLVVSWGNMMYTSRYFKLISLKFGFALLIMTLLLSSFSPAQIAFAQDNNPCAFFHTVQAGDNLFRISLRYGVSMQAIANLNGIADVTRIFVGDVLCIPSNSSTPSEPIAPNPDGDPNDNWCYRGGRWGDGRCNNDDPFIQVWNWACGWYNARDIFVLNCQEEFMPFSSNDATPTPPPPLTEPGT
jgi:LysM domain-containing protein